MDLENFYAKDIKELQNIVLMNIVNCSSDIRRNALKQFKDVKIEVISEIELAEQGVNSTVAAFFDENKNKIFFNTSFIRMPYFKHVLLHEMFHAYSYCNLKTGFYSQDAYNITVLANENKNNKCLVFNNNCEMFNEAATEYYASIFSDKRILSYGYFIPIYSTLCNVCGYDKLLNCYFSNNKDKLVNEIKSAFHLEDDYLIKKLFMQMDQCFNLENCKTNTKMITEAYKTLIDMFVKKANYDQTKKINKNKLCSLINIDNILNIKELYSNNSTDKFNQINTELKTYLKNYKYKTYKDNFSDIKAVVDNFVYERLLGCKNINSKFYKDYFYKNLSNVMLYLDQTNLYNIDGKYINADLPINEFLIFMHDKNRHIDLSNVSKDDKELFIKSIVTNCKHYIVDPKKHFYSEDLQFFDELNK